MKIGFVQWAHFTVEEDSSEHDRALIMEAGKSQQPRLLELVYWLHLVS